MTSSFASLTRLEGETPTRNSNTPRVADLISRGYSVPIPIEWREQENFMRRFRDFISWELEQERKTRNRALSPAETSAQRLIASRSRKLRQFKREAAMRELGAGYS